MNKYDILLAHMNKNSKQGKEAYEDEYQDFKKYWQMMHIKYLFMCMKTSCIMKCIEM